MADVPVKGAVLKWARDERSLTLTAAAELLTVDEEYLAKLEGDELKPNVGLLREMAQKYEIGFSSLLMPAPLPPTTKLDVEDFRTIRSNKTAWTSSLLALIDNVNIAIEGLNDLKAEAPDLFSDVRLPRHTLNDNPEKIAASERARLRVSVDDQMGWDTEYTAFKAWRAVVEAEGAFVYVMRAGKEAQWRGMSIFDKRAIPVIVINGAEDVVEPRIFSLWHEYCHLLLRNTAISDENRKHNVERFCNQFSAFFLMPRERFVSLAAPRRPVPGQDWTDENIRWLARRFKTSMSSVAIHLEEVGLARAGLYDRKLIEWQKREKKESQAVATHQAKIANKLGVRHVDTVLHALDAGVIDPLDANELLFDTKPKYFESLRKEIEERKLLYGRDRGE
ncbi:helix-turn-helix domain-containing protein [Hyphomicrobium zavarzinii]|uniref:helix-turn-helix domain-containing protein n=1 Tax=Hyphomicrobium zavarzinii TaxID=48292 RepID=UPI0003769282|nr:XRE family transcriptional regulator [Hyphomicrobium zavarzinii]